MLTKMCQSVGGMSGSYSSLARFDNSSSYIFAWVSRGASSLSENDWMGAGYTHTQNRTNGRRVAIASLSDKSTLATAQASSTLGEGGDSQITWVTPSIGPDRSNAHVATFDDEYFPGMGIHEMGTARMGRDPKTSVLNKWNQVWDAPNVFVTDGACMTSAACQNPSLTYMALTARAADFAVKELKKQNL